MDVDFIQLDNKTTEELLDITRPYESFLYDKDDIKLIEKYFGLQSWYHQYNLKSNKEKIEKLYEKLNCKENFTKRYEYKTYIWGFSYNEISFIFAKSERGTIIQFKDDTAFKNVKLILDKLLYLLNEGEKLK